MVSTTPVNVDMSLFAGQYVRIGSLTQEMYLCATDSAADTAIVITPTAPSRTAKVAEFIRLDTDAIRMVERDNPYWILRTVTGSGVCHLKPVSLITPST